MASRAAAPGQPSKANDLALADAISIPSDNRFISIEHPAILSSIEAGVRTLGGDAALNKAVNDPSNVQLELRYRPDDPYEHPIASQSLPVQNLVLKLTKSKEHGTIQSVEVAGVVDKVFRFRDIADFQYHPYPDSKFTKKFEDTFPGMSYDKISNFTIDMEEDDLSKPDIMPPPLFSRNVIPHHYGYKQNSGLIISEGRLVYRNIYQNKFITMVEKDIPIVPSSPSSHLDPLSNTPPSLQLCVERLRAFFAERPISTRRAIFNTYLARHGLGITHDSDNWRPLYRFALPYVCYMFRSGPFRDAYVLFGIDPRKEAKWSNYQTAAFNFRTGKWRNKSVVQDDMKRLWEMRNSHVFTGKDVDTQVLLYCFVDIEDPMLRKLIDESPLREKFHDVDGWYPAETMVKIRKVMRAKLMALRQGRIPSDEELLPILEDPNLDVASAQEEVEPSVPPEEEDEEEEGDDEQVEGEIVAEETEVDKEVNEMMDNVIQQSQEHQITDPKSSRRRQQDIKELRDENGMDLQEDT